MIPQELLLLAKCEADLYNLWVTATDAEEEHDHYYLWVKAHKELNELTEKVFREEVLKW